MEIEKYKYQKLIDHLQDEHGLILLINEVDEVERCISEDLAIDYAHSSLQLNEGNKTDFEQWLEAYNYKRNVNGVYKKDNKVYTLHLLHKMYFEYLDNI